MADIIIDGYVRVAYVPTIASIAAPTTTELNAGTLLHSTLVPGGLEGFEPSPGEVDNTAFDSSFDTKLPGISAFSGTRLMFKKQTGTDTIFNLLTVFNTAGYIVVRRNVDADTAWAASDKVEVYPITTGQFGLVAPERNTVSKYWVATPISAAPNMKAVAA